MTQVHGTAETGFKETEVGLIPADWDVVRLSDVVEFSRKPRGLDLSVFDEIPFVPMELIPDEDIFIGQYEPRAPEEIRSGSYCNQGDVLLAKITPSFENGKQGILDDIPLDFAYATTEVYAMHPLASELDRLFLFHYLRLPNIRADIAAQMEGTTGRQRVPKTVIEDYLLPRPPLTEQRRIAAVLNAMQQDIAAQEDIIAEARAFKRSLMQRLFTYGPGPVPAATRDSEIGEIPAHWEITTIGDLADFVGSGITPRGGSKVYKDSGIPFIRSQNVLMNRLSFDDIAYIPKAIHEQMQRTRIYPDDVLLNITGASIGRVAHVPESLPEANVNQHVCCIRIGNNEVVSAYIAYYLTTDRAQAEIMGTQFGTTRQGLNYGQVRMLRLALAPFSEQIEIVDALANTEEKIAVEEDRKAALQDVFKSTLHQLMTGQIRLLRDEGLV